VAMLMTDGDLRPARGTKALPQWRAAVQRTILTRGRVGDGEPRWGPRIIPAVSQRLVRARHDRARWLAVGDAALSVDPISGSGVVRALRTAQAAASTVLAALSGADEAIAGYEVERDKECTVYLVERATYYGIEGRWPDAPFWRRRVAVGAALTPSGRALKLSI
jgi:2-polyprenyl-6-methoxyphenol hydroxylase-like FAD-dependent oxidoreductase